MASASPSLIGFSWASADGLRRSLRLGPPAGERVKLQEDSHPGCHGQWPSRLLSAEFRYRTAAKKQAGSPFSMTGWKPILHFLSPSRLPQRALLLCVSLAFRWRETGWKPVFHHRQDACFPSPAGSPSSNPVATPRSHFRANLTRLPGRGASVKERRNPSADAHGKPNLSRHSLGDAG